MEVREFSTADYEVFESGVRKWMAALGLTEWRYEIRHDQIGGGTVSQVHYNNGSKGALFRLTKTVECDYGHWSDMEMVALHEVLHLLLADYGFTCAKARDEYADIVIGHEHEMINRLVPCLMGKAL